MISVVDGSVSLYSKTHQSLARMPARAHRLKHQGRNKPKQMQMLSTETNIEHVARGGIEIGGGGAPVDRNLIADGILLRRPLVASRIATEPPASRQNIVARPARPAGRRTREGGHKEEEDDGWMNG